MYKILIVDDEKIERNGMQFLLKRLGFDIKCDEAANGKAALAILQETKYDILLTDIKMPFMDGLELIKNCIPLNKDMKIIIFSGHNEFEYAKLAVKLGVSDYILKPVNPVEFESTLNKVIGELEAKRIEDELNVKRSEYMKEYFLYSLVNASKKDDVFIKANELMSMDFWNVYKKMLLIEFNRDTFGKIISDFKKEILDVLGLDCQYLNLNQQQAVVLFDSAGNMDEYKVSLDIHNKVYEVYNEKCFIAIADSIMDYSDIPEIMEKLDVLMENKFYQNGQYIFTENEDKNSLMIVQIDDDTLMKQMKQDIKMKDAQSLKEHFDRLCKKYRNKTDFSQIYIKFIFSNLLKDFYDNIPQMKEEELNKEIDSVYKSADINCVMDIVNINIERLEKNFASDIPVLHKEVDTVKKYIYEHYNEEIGVEQLADMVYLAPSYLSSVFKKETGQNLSKFIKAYRMEQAKEMLENTHKKIVDISIEVGYANVSYFCQSFREYFGVSPQKFRAGGTADE